MPVNEQKVREALQSIRESDGAQDIVALNQVKSIKIFEATVAVEVATTSPAKDSLRQQITAALSRIEGVAEVFVSFTASLGTAAPPASAGQKPAHTHGTPGGPGGKPAPRGLLGVKQIVAVGAGKGGVGKSTIAVNLAIGLALSGKKVALLDGDIYGPSIPTLTGIGPRPPQLSADRIIPFVISAPASLGKPASIAVMSIGFMVDKEKALIWRGPMAHGAMKQMIEQVVWTHGIEAVAGEQPSLDYLIVDLPPGTGDVSLTLAQTVPLTGAVIVATPQEVALVDARRAVRMFQQLGVEILGVVENMSYFVCEHGSQYDIFGRGGAEVMAQQMGLPFLGAVPIDTRLRQNSDAGTPFANFDAACPSREPLLAMTDLLDKQVAVRLVTRPAAKALNLTIS